MKGFSGFAVAIVAEMDPEEESLKILRAGA